MDFPSLFASQRPDPPYVGSAEGVRTVPDDEFTFRPMVSIGICSGEVIGDVANTAKRLQNAAKPGQSVIPAAVYEQIRESFNALLLDHSP